MARKHDKLDITPKVIDLGTQVIQLSHVASAGYGTSHPFRPFGFLSLAGGLALIGYEVWLLGPAAFAVKGDGAPHLWLAFGALGVGLFLAIFARRLLVVRTSDGQRTVVRAGDEAASASVIEQIRDAMEMAGQPVYPATLPGALQASAGEPRALPGRAGTGSQPAALGPSAAWPQITAQSPLTGIATAAIIPTHTTLAAKSHPASMPGGEPARHADPYVNGAAGRPVNGSGLREPLSAAEAAAIAQRRQLSQLPPADSTAALGRTGAGAATEAPSGFPYQAPVTRERQSLPQTQPTTALHDSGPNDLHALIAHVRSADVQHKQALLDLLRVVDDYYQGRASREDAVAHWRSFADYVAQYLGDVEGLLALAERYGRHMLAGR